jgi:hypothetical protein
MTLFFPSSLHFLCVLFALSLALEENFFLRCTAMVLHRFTMFDTVVSMFDTVVSMFDTVVTPHYTVVRLFGTIYLSPESCIQSVEGHKA